MEHRPQAGIKHAEQFIYLLMTQKYKCLICHLKQWLNIQKTISFLLQLWNKHEIGLALNFGFSFTASRFSHKHRKPTSG